MNRRTLLSLLGILTAGVGRIEPAAAGEQVDTLFESGLWFDGNAFVERAQTFVSGRAFAAAPVPGRSVSRVDLGGRFVVPPYGDALALPGPGALEPATGEATSGGLRERLVAAGIDYARYRDRGESEPAASDDPDQLADVVFSHPPFARAATGGFTLAVVGDSGDLLRPKALPSLVGRARTLGVRVIAVASTVASARASLRAGAAAVAGLTDASDALNDADAALAAQNGAALILASSAFASDGLRRATAASVRAFRRHGALVALGADGAATPMDAARALAASGAATPAEALRALCVVTPQSIFPGRKIGALAPGYEANFLVLERDPLVDPAALDAIALRFKAGRPVVVPP